MKSFTARSLILLCAFSFLFVKPVAASPLTSLSEVKLEQEKPNSQLTYDDSLTPFGAFEWTKPSAEKEPVTLTIAGGLVVAKLTGAAAAKAGTVVTVIALGKNAYKIIDGIDSTISSVNELYKRLTENKKEIENYAKMSYDTIYNLCHDKGGGMMSVPSVNKVKEEVEEDYIFGVPEKNAVCVAN